jgi:orotate phosphoribosyltransferase
MSGPDKAALLALLLRQEVLKFGDFTLKSGRRSPYFFNLGAISSGAAIEQLGAAYAEAARSMELDYDAVFGPAYKGIPIAVATAEALARAGQDTGWVFNRKEVKAHGEGGQFVGADVAGRLLLVDDVLTAGTAVREAAGLIREAGGTLVGVLIALDRQERLEEEQSGTAVGRLQEELGVPVRSLLRLQDVIEYLDLKGVADKYPEQTIEAIRAYQAAHCEQGRLRNTAE